MSLNRLLEPITIGKLTVSNRLVMPPMACGKTTKEGQITDEICDYYGKRADGGSIGLIQVKKMFQFRHWLQEALQRFQTQKEC